MVILVVFIVFLLVKNLEILIQIVPYSPIYYYYKRTFNEESVDDFKYLLNHVDWNYIVNSDTNESYNKFLMKFSELYDVAFPETKIEVKTKNLLSSWLTKGLRKSSKRKQKLYEKFLKKRNLEK